jgi:V8-like Glu-specific endopeptidase
MRPGHALIAVAMLGFLAPAGPVSGQPALLDSVWVAYRCRENNVCTKGTAFHVGDGVFYTNAHVARAEMGYGPLMLGRGTPRQELGRGTVLCINNRASLTSAATPYDVAKVRVDTARARRLPALKFYRWGPVAGLRIRIIGYPGNQWTPVIAEGTISQRLQHQVFTFEVNDGIVTRGSSGSPVLTTSGEVVGMVYAEGSGQLFATAVNWVLDTACR